MSDREDRAEDQSDQLEISPATGGRRTYERPRIIYRAPLEAMASVCAPSPPAKGNPGLCPTGPISS